MSFKLKVISTLTVAGAIAAFAGASLAQDTTPAPTGDQPGHHRHDADGPGKRGPGGRDGMRAGPMMGGPMMKGVNLTDAQKAQIKQIREANKPNPADFEAIKPLMEAKRNGTITADQQAQLKAFRQARQAKEESIRQQIDAIFTPDQKAQIEKNKAEMKEHREDWRKDHPNGKSGETTSPAGTTSKPGIN